MSENATASVEAIGQAPESMQFQITESAIKQLGALTAGAAAVRAVGNSIFLVLPGDFRHHDITGELEKASPAPSRKRGTAQLLDIDSFLEYVKDQAHAGCTYIYAHPDARTLTAVLNEHCTTDVEQAGWRDFRAEFKAELSREFANWMALNKKPLEQEEFAIFLEDNIADIAEPSGEHLLAIALTLQAKTDVSFSSSRRLDNGQVQFQYTETIDARAQGGTVEIPREFTLGLRVFKNGDGYKVRARLKYRLGGGKLKFWYELDRPEDIVEHAFEEYVAKARAAGIAPVHLGKA